MIHFLLSTAPGDYTPINSVVTIPSGRTQTYVEVRLAVDYDVENMESFQIMLSNPSEGAIIAESITTININDVDSKCNNTNIGHGAIAVLKIKI